MIFKANTPLKNPVNDKRRDKKPAYKLKLSMTNKVEEGRVIEDAPRVTIAPLTLETNKKLEKPRKASPVMLKPHKLTKKEAGKLGGRPKGSTAVAIQDKSANIELMNAKKKKIAYALELAVTKHVNGQARELAQVAGVPVTYATELLTSKRAFVDWRATKRRALDVRGVAVLDKLLRTIGDGRLSPYQAGMMYTMLHDKVMRPKANNKPENIINVGDNRKVSVYYPNFTAKDKKAEYNTAPKDKKKD